MKRIIIIGAFTALIFYTASGCIAQVRYSKLFSAVELDARKPDITLAVGAAGGGGAAVGGAATYVMPFACPPGTRGMEPKLSLSYNHFQKGGTAGTGWTMTGLSSIVRTAGDHYHDGEAAPADHSSPFDPYAIDGARLLLIQGAHGADGASYEREANDHSRILAVGQKGNGPSGFRLWAKDGRLYEYGIREDARTYTADGQHIVAWHLSSVSDADGNTMSYSYSKQNGETLPSAIEYTSNPGMGIAPYNKVVFLYNRKPEGNTVYDGGTAFPGKHLLEKVIITGEGNQHFKTYELSYGTDGISSYLRQVQEFGADLSPLNPTVFGYGIKGASYEIERTNIHVPFGSGSSGTTGYDIFNGDMDGDGKSDIITSGFDQGPTPHTPRVHKGYTVYHSTGNGQYTRGTSRSLPAGTVVARTPVQPTLMAVDINGDGVDDMLTYKVGNNAGRNTLDSINVHLSASVGGSASSASYSPQAVVQRTDGVLASGTYGYTGNEGNYIFTGDFDGDGRADVLTILNNACSGLCGTWAFLSFPAKGSWNNRVRFPTASSSTGAGFYVQGADRVLIVDMDGDGRHELMAIRDEKARVFRFDHVPGSNDSGSGYYGSYDYTATMIYEAGYPTKWHEVRAGDFNGDGKTDLMTFSNSTQGSFNISYSNGKTFLETKMDFRDPYLFRCIRSTGNDGFSVMLDNIYVGDFNGDGRDDVLHISPGCGDSQANQTTTVNIYYAAGDSRFVYEEHVLPLRISNYDVRPVVADVDGDGRMDLVFYPVGGDGFLRTLHFGRGGQERFLQQVVDGWGHRTRFGYTLLSGGMNYKRTKHGSYPLNTISPAMWAVGEIKVPDGIGGTVSTEYKYSDAAYHRNGRGFLGFGQIAASSVEMNTRTVEDFGINDTFHVPYLHRTTSYSLLSGQQISAHTNEVTFNGQQGGAFTTSVERTVAEDLISGAVTTTRYWYDPWGNVITKETDIRDTYRMTVTTGYMTNRFTGIPSLVVRVHTSRKVPGAAEASGRKSYSYDAKGRLIGEHDQLLDIRISRDYDGFGNLVRETTSDGQRSLSNGYTWDKNGRFQLSATNTLGQTAYSRYHPLWGTLSYNKGIDGLETGYVQDAFGNLERTEHVALQIHTTEKRAWADGAGNRQWSHTTIRPGRPQVTVWFDLLGRQVHRQEAHFNGGSTSHYTYYDQKGNTVMEIGPYLPQEFPYAVRYDYDELNRETGASDPLGSTSYSYSYRSGATTVQKIAPGGRKTWTTFDAAGKAISSGDGGGELQFEYDSWGNQTKVSQGNTVLVEKSYDARGIQTGLRDVDGGQMLYAYDVFGQLTRQTDANGNTHTMEYDDLGRLAKRSGPEGQSIYSYYGAGGGLSNQLESVIDHNGHITRYQYDDLGRMAYRLVIQDGNSFEHGWSYNAFGDLLRQDFPTKVSVDYGYSGTGQLRTVTDANTGKIYFEGLKMDGNGRYLAYRLADGRTTQRSYHFGLPIGTKADGAVDMEQEYDLASGNIIARRDNIRNLAETFHYDTNDRLTGSQVLRQGKQTYGYDSRGLGNLITKTGIGSYSYDSRRLHAAVYIDNPSGSIPREVQDITYTAFGKTATVVQGTKEVAFTYDGSYQKSYMVYSENGQPQVGIRYLDGCEIVEEFGQRYHTVTYVCGGDGLAAMVVVGSSGQETYSVYKDHLNSVVLVDNGSGKRYEQRFGAWGERVGAGDWSVGTIPALPRWLTRGYSGHVQLDSIGMVDMGARMYDPQTARMASADNMVGHPLATGGYNRYAYAMNNPLRYSDPDGNNPVVVFAAYVGIYAAANLAVQASQNKVHNIGDGLKAAGIGALQGALSYVAAGCPATLGWKVFANAGLSVAASWMPPLQVPLGSSATLSLSPTFGFGTGAFGSVGAGFGLGIRATLSVSNGDSTFGFSAGVNGFDDQFGKPQTEGVFSGGVSTTKGNAGTSFYLSSYSGAARQYSMTIGAKVGDFSFRYSNDAPFSDKFRTFAMEIGLGNFVMGTQVYTTPHDRDGGGRWVSPFAGANKKGSYIDHGIHGNGHVLGSPSYVGWKDGNTVYRFGINHPASQDFFQNGFHRLLNVPYYQKGDYLSPYGMIGSYNPYSLY